MHLETASNFCAIRRLANNFFAVFYIFELIAITKHIMIGPTGNSEFCFASALNDTLGFAEGNIEGLGETKLTTVSLRASHKVFSICLIIGIQRSMLTTRAKFTRYKINANFRKVMF